jgi:hypothetical protein
VRMRPQLAAFRSCACSQANDSFLIQRPASPSVAKNCTWIGASFGRLARTYQPPPIFCSTTSNTGLASRLDFASIASSNYRFQRAAAAFFPISLFRASLSFRARASPPFRPMAAAAGSFPCSSGVGGRSSTCPVAISILAAWLKSRGRLRWSAGMIPICGETAESATPFNRLPYSN